jgi:hypothetical protein
MLQVATFKLPDEQSDANAFLAKHRPSGEIVFNSVMLFIGYDDGQYPVEHEVSMLKSLIASSRDVRLQQEVAKEVMTHERDGLNYTKDKAKYDGLSFQIHQVVDAIQVQLVKETFIQQRIDSLLNPNAGNANTTGKAGKKGKAAQAA